MIAIDASVVIGWFNGFEHPSTDAVGELLRAERAWIAPAVVAEIYSERRADREFEDALKAFRVIELEPGYWARVGRLRAELFRAGRKAAMADALIAQASIDADLPLLTRDRDFRAFVEIGGLKLA